MTKRPSRAKPHVKRKSRSGHMRGTRIAIGDPSVAQAFAAELGHDAPFSKEEVAEVTSLHIQYARDIRALAACRSLQQLIIRQSEIDDLRPLRDLSELSLVQADYTSLRDISDLAELPKLYAVFLSANLVDDISPLLGLNVNRLTVLGNPLSEYSQQVVLEELRTTSTKLFGKPPSIKADTDSDWKLTCELQVRGWDAVFLREEQSTQSFVVRPGLRYGLHPEADAIPIAADQLRAELARKDVTFAQLIERYKVA